MALGTSCSEAERGSNLAQCLEKIVEAGFNNDLFWFGTRYETDCPSGPATIDCSNPRPQSTKRSIFTRLFPPGYDPSIMDRYLKMVFTSPPGNLQFEPPRDKTSKMACAPSEDSGQPGHPSSLIRVFAVRVKKLRFLATH